MRALQKLSRKGNSIAVSIPRPMLFHLGWISGEAVILELLEDKSIRIRRPCERDFAPLQAPRLMHENPNEVKA